MTISRALTVASAFSLFLLAPALAAAQSTPVCPAGSRYATNGANLAFCIFDGLSLPPQSSSSLGEYCDYLQSGYIGYSWTEVPANASYACPTGSWKSNNGYGADFCIFDVTPPSWAQPYCNYLAQGYIGYSWTICPPGAQLVKNGASGDLCLYENIPVPKGAQEYCEYLQDGYFGYSYPLATNPTYKCPSEFRQTTNQAGLGFCLAENLYLSSTLDVTPYCGNLAKGIIGFDYKP
jgi:hypothetical protein